MMKSRAFALGLVLLFTTGLLSASVRHEMTYKGTVISTTEKTIKVDTVDEKTKKTLTIDFKFDKDTKMFRGDKRVTYAEAKVLKGEKIAVTVDHDLDEDLAIVIKLDAKK